MNEIQTWIGDGKYLPAPLRDFHDQKDCFKAMHSIIQVGNHEYAKDIGWVAGQCYTIDIFLWFMAHHGWTLQKSRQKLDFRSLESSIALVKQKESEHFAAFVQSRKSKD